MALSVETFRAMFPAFADVNKYPDAMVSGYFEFAECWLGEHYQMCQCSEHMYYQLTAHLLFCNAQQTAQLIGGSAAITSSSVGGVSTCHSSVVPPHGFFSVSLSFLRRARTRFIISIKIPAISIQEPTVEIM